MPELPFLQICFVLCAALLQIAATSLMVKLFKQKNFAIGAGIAKSEALVAGVLGTLFFGSQLTAWGWLGVLIGAIAVFVLSSAGSKRSLSGHTLILGLACGTCFALTSLLVREASLLLALPFAHGAAWVLLWVLCLQTALLTFYIKTKEPDTFSQLKRHGRLVLATSFTSCIGSIGWFSAMALQQVAYVKTLGQVEVALTILISVFWLKNPVKKHEIWGLTLISLAAILVMWG